MSFSPSYYVNSQETAFDARLKKVKTGADLAEDATWDNAPAEVIRAQFERLAKTEQEKQTQQASASDMDIWVKTHPEFRDTPLNARQLLNQTRSLFGTTSPTLEQAEAAYESLQGTGLLDINQAELARQKDKRDTQRAKEINDAGGIYAANHPSESEMYSMDMDELRRLGNNTKPSGRGRL